MRLGGLWFGAGVVTDGVFEAVTEANSYTSDFSAGVDGWAASGGAVAGNIDGIGGQNDNLRLTIDNTNAVHYLADGRSTTIGKTCRVRYDYYLPSTNSHMDGVRLLNGNQATGAPVGTTQDAWTATDFYHTNTVSTGYRLYGYDGAAISFQDAGGDDVFYVRNFRIEVVTIDTWNDTADGLSAGTDGAGALNNKASWDGSQASASTLTQSGILSADVIHEYVYTVTRSAGTITPKCGTASGTARNSAATYTENIANTGNTNLGFEADASFVGTVDLVSVRPLFGT